MGTSPWGEGTRTFLSEASLTDTHTRSPATPTPPGAGAVRGDKALSGSPPGSPRGVGHGGYRHGGRGPGRGLVPSPGKMVPARPSPSPHPAHASRSSPTPSRGRGQSGRYPVGSRARERQRSRFPGKTGKSGPESGSSPGSPPGGGPWGYRHGGEGTGGAGPEVSRHDAPGERTGVSVQAPVFQDDLNFRITPGKRTGITGRMSRSAVYRCGRGGEIREAIPAN